MRFVTIIWSLFILASITNVYGLDCRLMVDTIKSQKNHHIRTKVKYPAPPDKAYYNDCVFTNKFTISQRLKKYPFSKAIKILAVSYDGTPEFNEDITTNGDTLDPMTHKKYSRHKIHGLHFDKDTLNYVSLFEMKLLSPKQTNRLTNILYNTDHRVPNNFSSLGYSCFNPRNALIFYDKNGKVFDYLEICFECNKMRSKSGKIFFHSACTQNLDFIKEFLIDVGIKYGTLTMAVPIND